MDHEMKKTLRYIEETLGLQPTATPVGKSYLDKLPMFINETFKLYQTEMFNTEIILAELKNEDELSIQQTEKQVQQINNLLNQKVVVVLVIIISQMHPCNIG